MVYESKPWLDCGCPLGMTFKVATFNKKPMPHSCGLTKDEYFKHYICDHDVYVVMSGSNPTSMIGEWVTQHLKERRLYVVRGPPRPNLKPQPWKWERPDMNLVKLMPGWKGWNPELAEIIVDQINVDGMLDTLGVFERWRREEMASTVKGFLLSCGYVGERINRMLRYKCDRVFITSINDFYQCMARKWMSISHFLYKVELGPGHIGPKMSQLKRFSDIEIDASIKVSSCYHL